MTKARDIASAAPAPSTVSATEIGYLDGVSSAIQTQIDGKVASSLVDAKGDLLVGSADNTLSRLAVASTAGYVLTVDSAQATGLKWAAAAAGGKVLQVVQATNSTSKTISNAQTLTDTNLTATITPTLSSSKVLVLVTQPLFITRSPDTLMSLDFSLVRGSTTIWNTGSNNGENGLIIKGASGSPISLGAVQSISYLDSPATTSATTYKTQVIHWNGTNGATIYCQLGGGTSTMILMEIGA